jgi:hypothetical protein
MGPILFSKARITASTSSFVAPCCSTLAIDAITVARCLPPKCRLVSSNDASVICMPKYIAICRGNATALAVHFCWSLSTRHPEEQGHTALLIAAIVPPCQTPDGKLGDVCGLLDGYEACLFSYCSRCSRFLRRLRLSALTLIERERRHMFTKHMLS